MNNLQLNFMIDSNSYRLDYDEDFKSITLYQIWENKDDKKVFTIFIGD